MLNLYQECPEQRSAKAEPINSMSTNYNTISFNLNNKSKVSKEKSYIIIKNQESNNYLNLINSPKKLKVIYPFNNFNSLKSNNNINYLRTETRLNTNKTNKVIRLSKPNKEEDIQKSNNTLENEIKLTNYDLRCLINTNKSCNKNKNMSKNNYSRSLELYTQIPQKTNNYYNLLLDNIYSNKDKISFINFGSSFDNRRYKSNHSPIKKKPIISLSKRNIEQINILNTYSVENATESTK